MKKFGLLAMVVLFLCMFSYSVLSQETTEYIVTSDDIQVCFPYTDPNGTGQIIRQWYSPEGSTISYSQEPVGMHKEKAKLGSLRFDALLQADEPSHGKAVVDINIATLPAPDRRTMEFRFRVRSPDGSVISQWSEAAVVKFIGKPGKPARVEIPNNPS